MFAKNFIKLKEIRNLDRYEMAKILNVTYQAIYQLETEKREPSLKMLKRLSEYFGVSIDWLLSDEEEESYNAKKIKEIILSLRYTNREFADEIFEPREEIEKVVEYGYEPSLKIINSICEKFNIPLSEFKTPEQINLEIFKKAEENNEYIAIAMYAKEANCPLDKLKALIDLIKAT